MPHLSRWQGNPPTDTMICLPVSRSLPNISIKVPPDTGPILGSKFSTTGS